MLFRVESSRSKPQVQLRISGPYNSATRAHAIASRTHCPANSVCEVGSPEESVSANISRNIELMERVLRHLTGIGRMSVRSEF